MAKVTGIGGVFIKARGDAGELRSWYRENLGLVPEDFGAVVLNWGEDIAEDDGATHWCLAASDSAWFSPSQAAFMINYRVDDMEGIIGRLSQMGTELIQGPETQENGIFAWLLDPDGNKIELWEPKVWNEKNKFK